MTPKGRIDSIKQRSKPSKSRGFLRFLMLLGLPLLGIAALVALYFAGIIKFQNNLLIHRFFHIVIPVVCGIFIIFLLPKIFSKKNPRKFFVRLFLWIIILVCLVTFLILIAPDWILIEIQTKLEFVLRFFRKT